jgi:hypothetical protein
MPWIKRNRYIQLLLVCFPLYVWEACVVFSALAQDQTLRPTSDVTDAGTLDTTPDGKTCDGTACSSTDCYLGIDEDPDVTTDDSVLVNDTTSEVIHVVGFATPTSNPSQNTDAQEVRINVSECNADLAGPTCEMSKGTGQPQMRVYLYCDSIQQEQILGDFAVPGTQIDQAYGENWTYDPGGVHSDCEEDGSDVEFGISMNVHGKSGQARSVCYESVEWNVTWASEGRRRMGLVE